ncbi:GNAT family N-acetyltransferase [Pseudomonas sp. PDM16]|uniref:GNAT family N-acetyltransferase n=1 Tax=Pseudomonas sp. PDM16 TaxID=2769292 RepID=UPI001781A5A1|nr:GNAT family N-acetyltransferase [Pseudomonas sp. PDM16]MBD9415662.1 GNAT family N-acetyltransferase [Pseudomonas sp. PDM16]
MQIELVPTTAEQLPLIANLYQYYAYESSDWEEEDVETDGRFYLHEPHLARYWQEPDWSANLILADGFIAGFLLIERSELAGIDALEFADLFVLKRYRRHGIGRALSERVLCSGDEAWLVRFHPQDNIAAAFWQAVLPGLLRPSRQVALDDEPELINYLITPAAH